MTAPTFRYAPKPPPKGVTVEVWNLAWLSHDIRKAKPYPGFMDDVKSMMEVDVTIVSGKTSYDRSAQALLGLPAVSAAILLSKFCDETDLTKAMGPKIRETWMKRARLSRGDHPSNLNSCIDWTILDTDIASRVLEKYRLANNP